VISPQSRNIQSSCCGNSSLFDRLAAIPERIGEICVTDFKLSDFEDKKPRFVAIKQLRNDSKYKKLIDISVGAGFPRPALAVMI
jgi:hypothetical protein